jgi:transcriptional regulator with XRE-family HTH domain
MARAGRPPKYAYYPKSGFVVIDPGKLRYWRAAREMTRDELGIAARLSPRTIEGYEQGLKSPNADRFRALFIALGVGPEDLLFEGSRYIAPDKDVNF